MYLCKRYEQGCNMIQTELMQRCDLPKLTPKYCEKVKRMVQPIGYAKNMKYSWRGEVANN